MVAYARGAPGDALLEEPEAAVRRDLGFVIGAGVMAGSVLGYKAYRFARKRASQPVSPDVLKLSRP
jgi:hypothetical protein